MITKLANLGMKQKLYLLAGVSIAGLIILGVVAHTKLNTVKVNGPYYQRAVENKDLLNDVMAPANHIVETYLTAERMRDAKDKEALGDLLKQYTQLKKDFADRQDY